MVEKLMLALHEISLGLKYGVVASPSLPGRILKFLNTLSYEVFSCQAKMPQMFLLEIMA